MIYCNISIWDMACKKNIIHKLELVVVSGDQQTIKTQGRLTHPLIGKVILLERKNTIPVSGFPVIFSYESGDGELDKYDLSGTEGLVQTKICARNNLRYANL